MLHSLLCPTCDGKPESALDWINCCLSTVHLLLFMHDAALLNHGLIKYSCCAPFGSLLAIFYCMKYFPSRNAWICRYCSGFGVHGHVVIIYNNSLKLLFVQVRCRGRKTWNVGFTRNDICNVYTQTHTQKNPCKLHYRDTNHNFFLPVVPLNIRKDFTVGFAGAQMISSIKWHGMKSNFSQQDYPTDRSDRALNFSIVSVEILHKAIIHVRSNMIVSIM